MPIFQPGARNAARPELEQLQRERLRERFGVELEALAEQPFRVKSTCGTPSFGLLQVPLEECVRIHASSDRAGRRPSSASHAGRSRGLGGLLRPRAGSGGSRAGHGRPHRVRLRPLHRRPRPPLRRRAARSPVGAASGGNTPRQAQLLEDLGAEILCCTPSYALAIADHVIEPARLALRAGVFGAEAVDEGLSRGGRGRARPRRRQHLRPLGGDGAGGLSSECVEGRNGAHVNRTTSSSRSSTRSRESRWRTERSAELVFTTLTKEALPLLRYRTGDLASLTREPCVCDAPSPGCRASSAAPTTC